ncbi:MAG TPA: NAD(P)/FAD-dependent oxidoreductase [Bacteroidetes bacterium]|nr:NAD(P)/FAD-dependent oxidoreductase [Bacteroidota bacterium]
MNYDFIIIGGGHNALVTATELARAGKKVLLLEKHAQTGGAVLTEELFPGFRVSSGARDAAQFSPELAARLGLSRYGLEFIEPEAVLHAPAQGREGMTLWRDIEKTCASIRLFSEKDARRYPDFIAFVQRMCSALQAVLDVRPPDLSNPGLKTLLPLIRPALKIRGLGRRDMMEFLRVLPMTIEELLSEWFENDCLKGMLAMISSTGTELGAQSAGTAFLFLYHSLQSRSGIRAPRFVRGGMGALAAALEHAAVAAGAELRCRSEVSEITIKDGQVAAVCLADGEEIRASRVISGLDPHTTFFQLVRAENLPVAFVRAVRAIRMRGVLARLELAVDGLPYAPGTDSSHLAGQAVVCPSLDYLERAYDATKYGSMSEAPCLDVVIPTLSDPTVAPAGKHLISINAQFAPHTLREGEWDDSMRQELQRRILQALHELLPGIGEHILHSRLLTPVDMEDRFGMSGGDIFHGQMALDQLFIMRPVPGWSRYRTPIRGLYLCGSGTHPGGGVTGAPGWQAAKAILAADKDEQTA